MFRFLNKKIKQNTTRGFTLLEMTVVAGIFGILTAIVVFKYGDFTSNLLVSNMAYEIALTTRQAQVFGVGVRGFETGNNDDRFQSPYGVYFNLNDGSSAQPMQSRNFTLFIDRDNDLFCDDGVLNGAGFTPCTCTPGDECIDQFSMQRNIRLTEIQVGDGNQCLIQSQQTSEVAVTFKRPSPEARIRKQDTRENTEFPFVQLKVEAPGSSIAPSYVLIRNNGQISVSSTDICDNGSYFNV
jgi:prepilin-type N-terminal cleavage/methylation domain-containing protein